MSPLDAATVERLVLNAAEREAPTLLADLPVERHAEAYRKVFAAITVGDTADDISFVIRT